MSSANKFIRLMPVMGKFKISLPVGLSALAGYLFFKGEFDINAILLTLGIFLISASSSTINHIQEKREDGMMPRTQTRPLPQGLLTTGQAWLMSLMFGFVGFALLIPIQSQLVMLLAFIALLWYNVIYTPLKKVTAFAVIPGSVTGALPPLIGWVAAGGAITNPTIWIVALFFFIGQIPHFWLLLMLYGDQYSLANMPTLSKVFSKNQLIRLTYTWILVAMASALLIPFKGIISSQFISFLVFFVVFYLIIFSTLMLFVKKDFQPRSIFLRLNVLYLLMMLVLSIEGFI
ncbi:protoheme IX farnesyltransferase [Prolixibacteraceae bacterium JC049]|nr:protoheme IX farnesyltransferase [Prolixibacteraceae bacterium JC049]